MKHPNSCYNATTAEAGRIWLAVSDKSWDLLEMAFPCSDWALMRFDHMRSSQYYHHFGDFGCQRKWFSPKMTFSCFGYWRMNAETCNSSKCSWYMSLARLLFNIPATQKQSTKWGTDHVNLNFSLSNQRRVRLFEGKPPPAALKREATLRLVFLLFSVCFVH